MESNISNRLKTLRADKKITAAQVARDLGLAYTTYYGYEQGTREPGSDLLLKLSAYYGVTVDFLLGLDLKSINTNLSETACHTYPVIGEVAAGFGSEAIEEETGDYEQIPLEWLRGYNPDNFFVLRVRGDSMYPKFIAGDRVLVHRQTTVDSGSIAVVLYDGNVATVKQVKYVNGEDWVDLIPINPEFQTKRVAGVDLEQCRVLGEVKRLIRIIK